MEFKRPLTARFRSDSGVEKVYASIGATVGDMLSYSYFGEPVGFDHAVQALGRWEGEYLRRGFRTVSIDDFIGAGGHGKDISDLLGVKREAGETPISHVERLLAQPQTQASLTVHSDKSLEGTYTLPSTK